MSTTTSTTPSSNTNNSTSNEISPENPFAKVILELYQTNMKKLDSLQTVVFITTGSMAGIFGLTNIKGLIFFIIMSFLLALCLSISLKFKIFDYFNVNFTNLWIHSLSNHAMTFLLFWTLAYALVYIY